MADKPLFDWPDDVPVHSAIMQAIGGASMCWHPRPTGEFDSVLASRIGEELIALLQRKLWVDV